jgi:hypothetical protein
MVSIAAFCRNAAWRRNSALASGLPATTKLARSATS